MGLPSCDTQGGRQAGLQIGGQTGLLDKKAVK